jgi:hypothetical protein
MRRGTMAEEVDDDALLDRLAKGLEAVRRDAELARSGGTRGVAAGLIRIEAELGNLATATAALRQRGEQQQIVILRLQAAAAKTEADIQALRRTVEVVTRQVPEQAERDPEPPGLVGPSARNAPPRGRARIGTGVLVLVLGGLAATWIASGREPTVGTVVHLLSVRFSEVTGIGLAGPDEPSRSNRTAVSATPEPAPVQRPLDAPASEEAAAPTTPAAVTAQAATPAFAPPPIETGAAPAADASASKALSSTQAPTETGAGPVATEMVPPPARSEAASIASPPVTPALAAGAPSNGSETTAATTPAQAAPPPQAVHQIVLRATAETWVQVRGKGGRMLLRRIMKPGETWPVPAEPDLLLDSGNAGGLELDLDGVPLRPIGARGGVIRDIALDASLLGSGAVRPVH